MGRVLRQLDVASPFVGVLLDNIYGGGPELDMGALLSNATITTQRTPLNDGDVDTIGRVLVSNAGNITGMVLQAGRYTGQKITVVNYGSGTIAFDVVGTSNVLSGATGTIAVNAAWKFMWIVSANVNSGNGVWVHEE